MTTFHQFSSPRMPEELRDLILTFAVAAHPARLVELRRNLSSTFSEPPSSSPSSSFLSPTSAKTRKEKIELTYNLTSPAKVPALLQVSSRSRELAGRRWQLTFPSSYYDSQGVRMKDMEDTARTYFDFDTDALTFNGDTTSHNTLDLARLAQLVSPTLISRIANVSIGLYGPLQAHGGWQGAREDYAGQSRGDQLSVSFPNLKRVLVVWKSLGRDERSEGEEVMIVKARTEAEEETRKGLERGVREARERRGVIGEDVVVELGVLSEGEGEVASTRIAVKFCD